MWINNTEIEKPIKDTDERPNGFSKGRLRKPKKIETLKETINKNDLIQYYIIENHSYIETMEHFSLTCRKDLRLLLTEYKISKDPKMTAKYTKRNRSHESYVNGGKKSSITQKKNWNEKSELEKQLWSDLQKESHSSEHFRKRISEINKEYRKNISEDIESERNKRRSESCKKAHEDGTLYKRQNEIKKENRASRKNMLCRTLKEQQIYDILIKKYPDIKYDVLVDERYPYYVDFYIPSEDLFIEYQGYPAHGNYPFIDGDSKSLEESIRLYGKWREIYIKTDVEKYTKALDSKINFIRIYPKSSLEENYKINQNKYKKLINLIYNI